ncbi:MAG: site-2 protease family protein [Gloeocapsa sp. DLM2.Bin57]|nr:MAG: site-2 protease family protein [Gloeocapsa sp. DLM2.Bin57]
MLNSSETSTFITILIIALVILIWGYNRSRPFGKLGIISWLQSVVLFAPWLIFFSFLTLGIYINIIGILLLLVLSIIAYMILGRSLRNLGPEETLIPKQPQEIVELETPTPTVTIPEADLQSIRGIFGIDTFFATETISYQEGFIFKGNLRGEPQTVHNQLSEKLKKLVGEKYRLFLVENGEGKPTVILLPNSRDPQPTTLAQKNLALALLVATIATSLETAGLLLGFDLFSDFGRYAEAIPISLGLWLILGMHELGHLFVAKRHHIRLSLPFFLPSWQIGSFGAITRFESLLPNRQILFDIAFAGPATGGLISLLLIIIGLLLSHQGSLFQIPSQFFQGSFLVGTLAKIILGSSMSQQVIDVHPLTLIGWLGLVITALNLLPIGQLDGGRMVQAIYGRKIARRISLTSLIILLLVAIINPANPILLYWGILILFLQRELERPSLNEISEVDDTRAVLGLLALLLMLATLIPLSPSLAGRLGIGS